MKTIAFVTSEEDPGLCSDDRLAIEPLSKRGYEVVPLVWDGQAQDFGKFDALIFRSCWNYHRKFEQFSFWLKKLQHLPIPVLNSVAINSWNLNKRYLLELHEKGVSIPRTEIVSRDSRIGTPDINDLVNKIGSDMLVIKPAVSLNGHDTYRISREAAGKISEAIRDIQRERDVLIQEYVPEIETSGEVSLIFFNGSFSHAIRKTPRSGEFRIHREYGGTQVPFTPSSALVTEAFGIVRKIDEPLLACRLDVVIRNGTAVLIELEIIDPMLFLGFSEGAPERFAQAIVEKLES